MFKSIFTKSLVAFMLIVLLSFSVIILLISLIIGEYSENEKNETMQTAALSCHSYMEDQLLEHEVELEELLKIRSDEIHAILTVAAQHSEDFTILLIDETGRLLMAVGSDADALTLGTRLPSALTSEATGNGGGQITQSTANDKLFTQAHTIYSQPILGSEQAVEGAILVCASSETLTDLTKAISTAIVHSILWILIAALIAVYFVTERIVSPLRSIRKAAKSFAEGNFDVRVPVRGKDELAELAVAFNNMAESMRQYDAMRNTFMSNVSHDLRTPMTSIAGFIDGILDGVIPPEKHNYYLQLVSTEVKRLSRLVSSLLDLSRIQAGERKFTVAPFDICEMGRQILISFEKKIDEKQLQVEFDCEEENMSVLADRDAIHQIFYNLCDNAVKFSSERATLRVSLRRLKNKKILVSVFNEGQGISDADLPYVFERFYKSDKSRGLNKSGVGLGLFIAKTIIDAHHEKIWVESKFGENCCFNFTLSCE